MNGEDLYIFSKGISNSVDEVISWELRRTKTITKYKTKCRHSLF